MISALRAAIVATAALALFFPSIQLPPAAPRLLVFVDSSPSIAPDSASALLASLPQDALSGIIRFGGSGDPFPDFASALAARESSPARLHSRILLLSDGLDPSLPTLRREALPAPVFARSLEMRQVAEAGIVGFDAPLFMRQGEPFVPEIDIFSTSATPASLVLFVNGILEQTLEANLREGENRLVFEPVEPSGGRNDLRVVLDVAGDFYPSNNSVSGIAFSEGKPAARLVAPDAQAVSSLLAALQAGGWTVAFTPLSASSGLPSLPGTGPEVVLFANVDAALLSPDLLRDSASRVFHSGGAIVWSGGDSAFGRSFAGTPSARMSPLLPLEMDDTPREPAALGLVLDRSGSMGAPAGNATKMLLANEAAAAAIFALDSSDRFFVIAADTSPLVVVPMSPAASRGAWADSVRRIPTGGSGIFVYPSIEAAWREMLSDSSSRRHILFFADADDIEEKTGTGGETALELVSRMAASGITLSVIALGNPNDRDVAWLRTLADRGNGRFHLTANASELPEIFLREASQINPSPFLEAPFVPSAEGAGRLVFGGIDFAPAPPLAGCNKTRLAHSAAEWVRGAAEFPLVAATPHGAGWLAAVACDTGSRWMRPWLDWDGYASFWNSFLRALLPASHSSPDFDLSMPVPPDASPLLRLEYIGLHDNPAPVLLASSPNDSPTELPLRRLSPSVWEGTAPPSLPALLEIRDRRNPSFLQREILPSLPDLEFLPPDRGLRNLRDVTSRSGGKFQPDITTLLRPEPNPTKLPTTPILAALALAAFLIERLLVARAAQA